MNTSLTKEQSQHLIDLGVPKEKASEKVHVKIENSEGYNWFPIFNLIDLLNILPKTLEEDPEIYFHLRMTSRIDEWVVGYYNFGVPYFYDKVFHREELIDALYDLAVYCLEWKVINFTHE